MLPHSRPFQPGHLRTGTLSFVRLRWCRWGQHWVETRTGNLDACRACKESPEWKEYRRQQTNASSKRARARRRKEKQG